MIGKGGLYGNVIRMAPPMIVSEREIDDAIAILDRALGEVEKTLAKSKSPRMGGWRLRC